MISRSNVDGGHDVDGLTRGRIKHSPTNSIPSKKREIIGVASEASDPTYDMSFLLPDLKNLGEKLPPKNILEHSTLIDSTGLLKSWGKTST